MNNATYDVIVIGGGIAGTAVAARLAEQRRVLVVEMEDQPGYHSTGRSAAIFAETYGNRVIRAFTRASRDFLFNPPTSFSEERLVVPREMMVIGRAEEREAFEKFIADELPAPHLQIIDAEMALSLCPVLRPEGLVGAVLVSGTADIEVHALHQGYIRQLRNRGGEMMVEAKVDAVEFDSNSELWSITTRAGSFSAPIVVNAAGAWADEVASMAGVNRLGVQPRRRTVALVDVPAGCDASKWPMILDVRESFYMKPDAGLLLISPADETLCDPEDSQPEEIDIAIAADRLSTLTTVPVHRIKSKWAGLRTFVEDRSPIIGYDLSSPGFFWLAALGGYGIQTAPALSDLAAKLILRTADDEDFDELSISYSDVSPCRVMADAGGGDPAQPTAKSEISV